MGKRIKECHYCGALYEEEAPKGKKRFCCPFCAPINSFAEAFENYLGIANPSASSLAFHIDGQSEESEAVLKEVKDLLLVYEYLIFPSLTCLSSLHQARSRSELERLCLDEKNAAALNEKAGHKAFFNRAIRFAERAYAGKEIEGSIAYFASFLEDPSILSLKFYARPEGRQRASRVEPFPLKEELKKLEPFLKENKETIKEASSWESDLFFQADEPYPFEGDTFARLLRALACLPYIYEAFSFAFGEVSVSSLKVNPLLLESFERIDFLQSSRKE